MKQLAREWRERCLPNVVVCVALILTGAAAHAQGGRGGRAPAPTGPWSDKSLSPDKRADLVLGQMTLDEKIQLLHGSQAGRGERHSRCSNPLEWRRGLRPRHRSPRHSRRQYGRFGRWRHSRRGRQPLLHPAAFCARPGLQLECRSGAALRPGHRPRTSRPGLQHVHRRRRRTLPASRATAATSNTPAKIPSSQARRWACS